MEITINISAINVTVADSRAEPAEATSSRARTLQLTLDGDSLEGLPPAVWALLGADLKVLIGEGQLTTNNITRVMKRHAAALLELGVEDCQIREKVAK